MSSIGKNSPNGTRLFLSYEFNKFKLWSYTERELKYLTEPFSSDLLFMPSTNKWFSLKWFWIYKKSFKKYSKNLTQFPYVFKTPKGDLITTFKKTMNEEI